MADTLDPKSIDKRTVERYARSGQLDLKAYEKSLKTLPDLQEKSAIVETVMFEDEEDDFDDEGDEGEDAPGGDQGVA